MSDNLISGISYQINHYPITIILIPLWIGLILLINWLWREVLSPTLAEHTKKQLNKKWQEREEEIRKEQEYRDKIHKIEHIEMKRLHKAMVKHLQNCYRDGWRNDTDRELIENLYADYIEVGGNHDGEGIINDFYKSIPYKTDRKTPQKLGIDYPPSNVMDIMNDIFDGVNSGLIPEDKMKKPKNIIDIKGEK